MKKMIHLLTTALTAIMLAGSCTTRPAPVIEETDGALVILLDGVRVLTYAKAETPVPEGVNPLFRRSAYIHPLRSPGGEVLTRIQPPDHYHHYGIWNPWTHTRIDGKRIDFWNLGEGQGRVRFAELLDTWTGEGSAGFLVRQEHVWYPEEGTGKVAINETWRVEVSAAESSRGEGSPQPGGSEGRRYTVDLDVTLNCPLEGGILLEQYRYGGGLGFRATKRWGTDNSTVRTSEGKTRKDADGSHGRWVIVEGESSVPEGRSGILFLSHPGNQAHPEPMRVWPQDQYEGKSNLFFEFCPIRHQEWPLEQGKDYLLKYRMVVFDGTLDPAEATHCWQQFVSETSIP